MASTTRQALLQALSAAEGAYISGQQLAQQLGVSRAAVHKAAAALTAQGYALEAASRRGYRLLGGDPFCTEAVGPYPAPVQLYDTQINRWMYHPRCPAFLRNAYFAVRGYITQMFNRMYRRVYVCLFRTHH